MKQKNSSWYSVIASVLMVGFLLILASWVFHLVLLEMQDNRGREDYLKASQAAEWALELALLKIKDKWYGYHEIVETANSPMSFLLAENPLDEDSSLPKDTLLSYSMDGRVLSYSGHLQPLGYDIIPLFSFDDENSYQSSDMELIKTEGNGTLSWNIVSTKNGISWQGNFDSTTLGVLKKFDESWGFSIVSTSLWEFFSDTQNVNNYIILLNSHPTESLDYSLISHTEDGFFTKPRLTLISSGKNTKFKQNLQTLLDNTEYLSILRYSIFSDN